jgi:excisionase family DNA binding protein
MCVLLFLCVKTYTTVQLAKHLGIGRDTLYRWMRAKKIRGVQVTRFGNIRVRLWTERDAAEIRRYMKQHYGKGKGRKKLVSTS